VVYLHEFCTPFLDEGNGQLHILVDIPGKRTTSSHWIGSRVGPRPRPRFLAPASSQSVNHPAHSSVTTLTICCSSSLRHYKGLLMLWYFGQYIDGLSDSNALLRGLFGNLGSYRVKVLKNNTMCICIYIYIYCNGVLLVDCPHFLIKVPAATTLNSTMTCMWHRMYSKHYTKVYLSNQWPNISTKVLV
jgi:hypothetical protein